VDYWLVMAFETSRGGEQMRSPSGFAQDVAWATRVRRKLPSGLLTMRMFGGESARAQNLIDPQARKRKVIRRNARVVSDRENRAAIWPRAG
jgi:hypothetical protein